MRQMKTRFALALVFTLALALGGSALAAGPENKGAEKRKDDDRAGVSKKGSADDDRAGVSRRGRRTTASPIATTSADAAGRTGTVTATA